MLRLRVPKKDSIRPVALISKERFKQQDNEAEEDFNKRVGHLEPFRDIVVDVKMASGAVVGRFRNEFNSLQDRIKRLEFKKKTLSEEQIKAEEQAILTTAQALYLEAFDDLVVAVKGLEVCIGDDEPVMSEALDRAVLRDCMERSADLLNLVCLAALQANALTIDEKKHSA